MIKKMKQVMVSFFALSSFFVVYEMAGTPAHAVCSVGEAAVFNGTSFNCEGTATDENDGNIKGARNYLGTVAMVIAGVSLAVGVLVVVYAAFLYTTSGGDAVKMQQAKLQIVAAAFAIFIATMSFVISGMIETLLKV